MSEFTSVLSTPALAHALTEIIDAVAALYRVGASDITGRARTKAIAEARCCVYLLARRCTRMSYPEIGRELDRDHTTVMAGVVTAERLLASDRWFAVAVDELLERFGEVRGEERVQ